jgi:F0F1-type ATP synthase membrane subunit c/vacuolar-type H+-ATPase subunit K
MVDAAVGAGLSVGVTVNSTGVAAGAQATRTTASITNRLGFQNKVFTDDLL